MVPQHDSETKLRKVALGITFYLEKSSTEYFIWVQGEKHHLSLATLASVRDVASKKFPTTRLEAGTWIVSRQHIWPKRHWNFFYLIELDSRVEAFSQLIDFPPAYFRC